MDSTSWNSRDFEGTAAADCCANNNNNNSGKSFPKIRNAFATHLFNCFLLIFVASFPGELSTANLPSKRALTLRNDLLCNSDSEHKCICNRSMGNLDNSEHLPCRKFIEGNRIEVVRMVMRGINLNSILHTNETYEQYLRRRIARILSQYCENMPKECTGTLADLHSSPSNLVEINNRTTAVIYDEPVFSRESVVILRVAFPPGKARTEFAFVVVKSANTIRLSQTTTFNPTKVKYILSAQIAPLSRVLGGIRIEQFGTEVIEKPEEEVDNTKLLIMIGVIGVSIFFCCTIAAIRQICLLREQNRRVKRPNQSVFAAEEEKKSTRNYGTCTEKFFSNYDLSNGHVKSKSLCSRDSMHSSRKAKRAKKASKCSSEAAPQGPVLADRTLAEEPSPRPYQNIFICDHSQLPKEEVDDEFEMEIQRLKRQNLQVRSPRSPFSSDDDATAYGFQGFQFPERSPTEKSIDKRNSFSENIPSVVLNDERKGNNSPNANDGTQRHNERKNQSSEKGSAFLCALSEDHPFERPLSRRGSVNETDQEEGEEGTNHVEAREDTPDPLGDVRQERGKEKPLIFVLRRNRRERSIPSESGTDEAEEGEEEEATDEEDTLYQPLKEVEGEWLNSGRMPNGREGHAEQMSSSEGDASAEKAMLDRHHYERLLESPGARQDTPKTRNNTTPKIILND